MLLNPITDRSSYFKMQIYVIFFIFANILMKKQLV